MHNNINTLKERKINLKSILVPSKILTAFGLKQIISLLAFPDISIIFGSIIRILNEQQYSDICEKSKA